MVVFALFFVLIIGAIFVIAHVAQAVGQTIATNLKNLFKRPFQTGIDKKPPDKPIQEQNLQPIGPPIQEEVVLKPKYNQPVSINSNYYRVLNSTIYGPVIGSKNKIDENSCKKFCDETFNCRVYDYSPITKHCKINGPKVQPGNIIGLKRPDKTFMIHVDKKFDGDTIYNGVRTTPYMSSCEDMCKSEPDCHWYNFELSNKKCTLQKSNFSKGNIIGIKPASSGK